MDRPGRLTFAAGLLPLTYALLRWLSQPPLAWGWIAFVAIVPLLMFVDRTTRPRYRWVWLAGFLFWLVTLQGLRHTNPLLYPAWVALAAYLGIYPVLSLVALRCLRQRSVPMVLAAPIAWVSMEWIRNYFATGLSACMIGHSLVDYPILIQIADLGGSYAVSFLIVAVNAAWFEVIRFGSRTVTGKSAAKALAFAFALLLSSLGYGMHRLGEPTATGELSIVLLGLDQQTEYDQDLRREQEIYQAYATKTVEVARTADAPVHLVIWPESMFSGGMAWTMTEDPVEVPPGANVTRREFDEYVRRYQVAYRERAADLLRACGNPPPDLIAGGGVIVYGAQTRMYSGLVHVSSQESDSPAIDWYGKTHLVMFGEYVPVLSTWSFLRPWVPEGLGLAVGDGPQVFDVGGTRLLGNICIETAVERVTIDQLHDLRRRDRQQVDAIVTVTNDAWFDHSSVVEHHLRCGQFLAVGCRRPILSAGNGGPTAWIDSCGRVIDRVPAGQSGTVVARPEKDSRQSMYSVWRDWPITVISIAVLALMSAEGLRIFRERRSPTGSVS